VRLTAMQRGIFQLARSRTWYVLCRPLLVCTVPWLNQNCKAFLVQASNDRGRRVIYDMVTTAISEVVKTVPATTAPSPSGTDGTYSNFSHWPCSEFSADADFCLTMIEISKG
jgi:hypothetical protein